MFDFLQGLAFGLLVSFMPWFMAGLYDPRLVVPEEVASRWQVILRYAVAMPSVAMLLLMTSFWAASAPASAVGSSGWRRCRSNCSWKNAGGAGGPRVPDGTVPQPASASAASWPVPAASAT